MLDISKTAWLGYADNMVFNAENAFNGTKFIDKGFDAGRSIQRVRTHGSKVIFSERMSRFTIYSEKLLAQLMTQKNLYRLWRRFFI